MNVSFVRFDPLEHPVLVLKTAHESTIGILANAGNVGIKINYNEISTIEFEMADRINGEAVMHYDDIVGMRIIELVDVGQFILLNPKETDYGNYKKKSCKCNSLEYEFTYKKITLPKNTYRLWDPTGKDVSVLGLIMEQMPSWSIGTVSDTLLYRYRTFEVSNENIYNFIKGTIQQSYGCIFEFDTFERKVNVIDADADLEARPVLITPENLAKEIEIEENSENIFTRLDINGADGVDIRNVNPAGTNKLINLDYFMSVDNFDARIIKKYEDWKNDFSENITPYHFLTIEHMSVVMRKTAEMAALADLKSELTSIENEQAVIIQAIARKLQTQADLSAVNARIAVKKEEITAKEREITAAEEEIREILTRLSEVQQLCNFNNRFTAEELAIINPYIKDGEISESSFVISESETYAANTGSGKWLDSIELGFADCELTMTENASNSGIYDISGGVCTVGEDIEASVVSAIIDIKNDGSAVISVRLGAGSGSDETFDGACLTLVGSVSSIINDVAADAGSDIYHGSELALTVDDAYQYFTLDVSEYDKHSVSWDLLQYGMDALDRLAWPTYTFHVSLANFMAIEDFVSFKNNIMLGRKIYLGLSDDRVLSPICVGLSLNYSDLASIDMVFSDTYSATDSSFKLVDLLEKSISMGKNVDINKFNYSSFVDSGAKSSVRDFMTNALDVSKNAIVSSSSQAISWDGAGFRLRKWANDQKTAYDDEQIWMSNNSVMMTDDGWETAKMAIGKFVDENLGECWGVIAPMVVGTLLAGNQLVIESEKVDGGIATFRVDGSGAHLYNSEFVVHSEDAHIMLDPALGLIVGKYPVYTEEDGVKMINEQNANFWVDAAGNVHIKGTLHGADGEFTGKVTATSLLIQSDNDEPIDIDEYIEGKTSSGIGSIDIEYYLSSSDSELIGGSWTTEAPEWIDGMYMWQRTVITYTNGSTKVSDPVCISGAKGQAGRGVSEVQEEFYLSTSKTELIGGTWLSTAPAWEHGKYMWTRSRITYTDGTVAYTTPYGDSTWEATEELRTETNTSFSAINGKIEGKVSTDVFNALDQRVATAETTIAANSESIRLSATKAEVNDAISGMQIGGRNLLKGTKPMDFSRFAFDSSGASAMGAYEAYEGGLHVTNRQSNLRVWLNGQIPVSAGQSITVSFKYSMLSGNSPLQIQANWYRDASDTAPGYSDSDPNEAAEPYRFPQTMQMVDGGWGWVQATFVVPDGISLAQFAFRSGRDFELYDCEYIVREFKVESGTKATDWSPAPEDTDAAIESLSAELTVQAGQISASAEKIETVNAAAANAQNAANAAQSTANGAVTRVTTAEGRISVVEGSISSMVTEEEFNKLGEKVSANSSAISQTPEQIHMAVESLQIGGTNMIRLASDMIGFINGAVDPNWEKSQWCKSGIGIILRPHDYEYNAVHFSTQMPVEPGEYMLSFWCWTYQMDAQPIVRCNLFNESAGIDHYFYDIAVTPNTPVRYAIPVTVTYQQLVNLRLLTWTKWTTGEMYFADIKFEKGNKATDWSPAPEDTDAAIGKVRAELTVTENNINQRVTNEVTGLQSQIDLTDEQVLILAGRKSGGTNLVRFSTIGFAAVAGNTVYTDYGVWADVDETWYYRSRKMIALSPFTGDYNMVHFFGIPLKEGTQYTASFNMWHQAGGSGIALTPNIWNEGRGVDLGFAGQISVVANTPTRYELTFTCPVTDTYYLRLISFGGNNAAIYLSDIKLEEGNTATAWSPNPEDPAGSVDAGGVVRVDQTGVHMSGGTIEMETSDGDEYIHIRNDGISASSLSAPNVAKQYSGPSVLYADANATDEQMKTGGYYRSLADACAAVSGKNVDREIAINILSGTYGEARLTGICGTGSIAINGNQNALTGKLYVGRNTVDISLWGLTITGTGSAAVEQTGPGWVQWSECTFIGNSAAGSYALMMARRASAFLYGCGFYNAEHLLGVGTSADVVCNTLKGGGGTNALYGDGGNVKWYGTRPGGNIRTDHPSLYAPADLSALAIDYGTAQPSTPTIQTAEFAYLYSDSYRGGWSWFSDEDIHQGYISSGTIYGVIWFDAAAIRSALNGRTINQVSLRLHMHKGVGRGSAVSVQMYGTNTAYSGRSGAPALTTSYGTIGTTEPDMVNEITIPTQVITDIVNGTIQGLVLKSDDAELYKDRDYSRNYAKFSGSTTATEANKPRLTVVYQ